MTLGRDEIAALIASDIEPGSYVNLGIGQPTLVADHLPDDAGIVLHTENGMLNMGPSPADGEEGATQERPRRRSLRVLIRGPPARPGPR